MITLRARPIPDGIAYRVEDEYEGVFSLPLETSKAPLTLAELIRQFEDGSLQELDYPGGLALGYNYLNADGGCLPEELRYFTSISSDFYPQLHIHFEHVFDDWVREAGLERNATSDGGAA